MKGLLSFKVIFHLRLSSNKGLLPSKVVIHQRLSSIKGHLPLKIVFFFWVIFIFGFLFWVWHCSAQPFVICFFEFVHLNDLHYFSLWAGPPRWPFLRWIRLLKITGNIRYRMKDRNKNRKIEFQLVGQGLTTLAVDKKWGFSFSSTTSLKSKVYISSWNLLHQVNYRGIFFGSLSYHDSCFLFVSIIRQA